MTELNFKVQVQSKFGHTHEALKLDRLAWHNMKAQVMNDLICYLTQINDCGGYILITIYSDRNTYSYQLMNVRDYDLIDHISKDLSYQQSCTTVNN